MQKLLKSDRDECFSILRKSEDADIAALRASHPGWEEELDKRKKKIAIGQLGIAKQMKEIEDLSTAIQELENKRSKLEDIIDKKMPFEEHSYRGTCPNRMNRCDAISDICKQIHDKELAASKAGKIALNRQARYQERRTILALCVTREELTQRKVFSTR